MGGSSAGSPERRLVVKHTFLEVVDKPGNRIRAFTDSVVESLRPRGEDDEEFHTQLEEQEDENAKLKEVVHEDESCQYESPPRGAEPLPRDYRSSSVLRMYHDLQIGGRLNSSSSSSSRERQQNPVVVNLDTAVAPLKNIPPVVSSGMPLSLETRLESRPIRSTVGPPGAHPALPSHSNGSSTTASEASSSKCSPAVRSSEKLQLSAFLPSDSWAGGSCNPRQRPGLHSSQHVGQVASTTPCVLEGVLEAPQASQSLQRPMPFRSGPDCDPLPLGAQQQLLGTDLPVPPPSIVLDSLLPTTESGLPMTTVMLRNLPNRYTRAMLLDMLDTEGFKSRYDFVYLPIDFKTHSGLGYAFVDLCQPEVAEQLRQHFEGFSRWCIQSDKVCTVSWSHPEQQGLAAHIKRYRNSPVMHGSVPDDWKPLLFQDGQPMPFPPPQRKLRAPHVRPVP